MKPVEKVMRSEGRFWSLSTRHDWRFLLLVLLIVFGYAFGVHAEEDPQWTSGFYRVDPERTPFKIRPSQSRRDFTDAEEDRGIQWREGRRDTDYGMSPGARQSWGQSARDSRSGRIHRPWGKVPSQWDDSGSSGPGRPWERDEPDGRYSDRWSDEPRGYEGSGPGRGYEGSGPGRGYEGSGAGRGYEGSGGGRVDSGYRGEFDQRGAPSRWEGPYQREYSRGTGRWGGDGARGDAYGRGSSGAGQYDDYPPDERPRDGSRWWGRSGGGSFWDEPERSRTGGNGAYWPDERR
ncbi:MAG: hypothetical protein H7834_11775 [Magnetococcus sp. YQC-9]